MTSLKGCGKPFYFDDERNPKVMSSKCGQYWLCESCQEKSGVSK